MLRRILFAAALALCTAIPTVAQERATVILKNGETHSGRLVYPRDANNIVDGRMHLATGSGELEFPVGEIAVVDIAGGTPTTAEASRVPDNDTGVMVMKSGAVIPGHLQNIMRGGLVQWVSDGRRQNYPIEEVRRMYLNSEDARDTYLRSTGASPAVGTSGAILSATVRVAGDQQWVDTGITVTRGDRYRFETEGNVEFAPGQRTNASGTRATNPNYPVPSMGSGGLIARIGDSAPFAVGAGNRLLEMPQDGRLYLGINDDVVTDNSGFYTVAVRRR